MIRASFLSLLLLVPVVATSAQPVTTTEPVALTLDEALQIALERNYAVRTAALDVATADAQVREAWGQVMPQVSASGSYTRNVISANPFAGAEAGGLFGAIGAIDWLAYNERARTDGDPATQPLSLEEFRRRQAEGFERAGLTFGGSDNPFGVPNQFQTGISINQTLYSGAAFAAIRGARGLREINEAALTQQQHLIVHQTRQLFYTALLAQQQAAVARASVERAQATQTETARRVAAGTLPVLERMTAEVEVTNLETQLMQVDNHAALATTNLLFQLGLPVDRPVVVRGELDLPAGELIEVVALEDAVAVALERRPEVRQAELAIELNEVNRDITRGAARPVVTAFANLNVLGNVPDDRAVTTQGRLPADPFGVDIERRGFFDAAYWNPAVALGARISWNLVDGFQTRYRVQQNVIAVQQAQIALEQARQAVTLEVDQAMRSLASARQRILAQAENVDRAETAYAFASARLATGVATQIDVRFASSQLDQARLGYYQAVYDYLVARSDLQRATGVVLPEPASPAQPVITTVAH
jgi:outer membrane protein TolC